jgi:hypothetical protein
MYNSYGLQFHVKHTFNWVARLSVSVQYNSSRRKFQANFFV